MTLKSYKDAYNGRNAGYYKQPQECYEIQAQYTVPSQKCLKLHSEIVSVKGKTTMQT